MKIIELVYWPNYNLVDGFYEDGSNILFPVGAIPVNPKIAEEEDGEHRLGDN